VCEEYVLWNGSLRRAKGEGDTLRLTDTRPGRGRARGRTTRPDYAAGEDAAREARRARARAAARYTAITTAVTAASTT